MAFLVWGVFFHFLIFFLFVAVVWFGLGFLFFLVWVVGVFFNFDLYPGGIQNGFSVRGYLVNG